MGRRLVWDVAVGAGVALLLYVGIFSAKAPPLTFDGIAVDEHLVRARTYEAQGKIDQAMVALAKAIGKQPGNRQARFDLGRLLLDRGVFAAAEEELQVAADLEDDAPVRVQLGLVELGRNRHSEAAAHLRRAIELDPASAVAHLDLGIALLRDGKEEEAVPVCETAVELDPTNLNARHNLGFALRITGDPARAITVLDGVVGEDSSRVISWYELGVARLEIGDEEKGKAAFARVLALEPGHGAARSRLRSFVSPESSAVD